jgi:NADPH:quinone reductase-like Zn-dependent oxidoreductase
MTAIFLERLYLYRLDVSYACSSHLGSANTMVVSGTGLYACQLAKHVFKAGKVITTVSTSKVPKVDELLGKGTVDQSKAIISSLTMQ